MIPADSAPGPAPERRYQVKSIFGPTIQGEGPRLGAPCLFVRLTGCNAWDGRAATRADSACPYCDTDFVGGEALTCAEILQRLEVLRSSPGLGLVLTGGEPLLQADGPLLAALGAAFPWVDIETNGTRVAPPRPAHVQVVCSPKAVRGQGVVVQADAWKILIPHQEGFLPQALASGAPVWVQPVCPDAGAHGPAYEAAVARCLELCYVHGCRLSLQIHKMIGVE